MAMRIHQSLLRIVSLLLLTCSVACFPIAQSSAFGQTQEKPAEPPIDFEKARELINKSRRGEKLTSEEDAYLERARAARRAVIEGGNGTPQRQTEGRSNSGKSSVGFTPIDEMTADARYKGESGGLYGNGENIPPEEHRKRIEQAIESLKPLDQNGKPSDNGAIVFISISMSNATQEFSAFRDIAIRDKDLSPRLKIVDCAQGGQAMAEWADENSRTWTEAERRLVGAGFSPAQVQVAWVKLANKSPRGDLAVHGKKLKEDTLEVLRIAKLRYPNLKLIYLSSRIYGGYATSNLNPEPYAYESGFVARWLIEDQIAGKSGLEVEFKDGQPNVPVLAWGPYLWADGTKGRKDGLSYSREDLAQDGTHPSPAGRKKIAEFMLDFYKTNEFTKSWFCGND